MKVYKCASYERLSKEDLRKKDESSSIESQRMIIQSFCKFNELEIIDDYVDDGYSGGNFDRPGFKRMIEDIESGKINCVITKDLSRLGRELYQTGTFVEDYFCDKKIRYIAINDGYDSNNDYNEGLSLKLTYNDYALRDTSRKVKTSFRAKQSKGEYLGTIARYGYVKDPEDNHHLIIDPIAAGYVKEMYLMALAGESTVSIANYLTSKNVPIPIVYKKEKRGAVITDNNGNGIWKHQTVKSILTSQMYIGNMVQCKKRKINYKLKQVVDMPKSEWIVVENTHEPIIEKEKFYAVQQIMKSKEKTRAKTLDLLLRGLVVCKDCGKKMSTTVDNNNNHTRYLRCSSYATAPKQRICTPHIINYQKLEDAVLQEVTEICKQYLDKNKLKQIVDTENQEADKENKIKKEKSVTAKAIDVLTSQIDKLYEDKLNGLLNNEDFKRLYDKKVNERELKQKYLQELENITFEKTTVDYEKVMSDFLKKENITSYMLTTLIEKIEVDNDKHVTIYYKFSPLNKLS